MRDIINLTCVTLVPLLQWQTCSKIDVSTHLNSTSICPSYFRLATWIHFLWLVLLRVISSVKFLRWTCQFLWLQPSSHSSISLSTLMWLFLTVLIDLRCTWPYLFLLEGAKSLYKSYKLSKRLNNKIELFYKIYNRKGRLKKKNLVH